MLGVISFRVYLIIAVTVGGLCAAVAYFDTGAVFAGFFSGVANDARPFLGTTITNFIFEPLIQVFSNIYWSVGAGILWPLVIVWFLLFLIALGATIIGPALSELNSV